VSEREVREAATACPFVAFDDDRDHRADRPDHRHRCFAEVRPASRAAAHQEAYCLSARFATCPTFVDWASREAARIRPSSTAESAGAPGAPPPPAEPSAPEWTPGRASDRDWAAPPPWLSTAPTAAARAGTASTGAEDVGPDAGSDAGPGHAAGASATSGAHASTGTPYDATEAPPFLASSDRTPSSGPPPRTRTSTERDAATAGAAAVAGAAAGAAWAADESDTDLEVEEPRRFGPAAGRSRQRSQDEPDGPSWERARRYEAYPTLRTRTGLSVPGGSPLILAAGGIIALALALFFIPPMLLGIGGEEAAATPTPTVSPQASASPEPTPVASPTPVTYVVKSGDTMSKIATQFGVSLDALIAANTETVPDPDVLQVGTTIIIPTGGGGEVPSPSPSG
jgi:hypothetical protein